MVIEKYVFKKSLSDSVMESKPSFDLRGTNSDSELSVLLSSRSVQRVYDPPADGSCFFHCIVKKLDLLKANSQNYNHLTLRHQTIGKQDTYANVCALFLNSRLTNASKNYSRVVEGSFERL